MHDEGDADLPSTKNLRAAQLLLLSYSKLESTVRYLGIEVDDALEIFEQPAGHLRKAGVAGSERLLSGVLPYLCSRPSAEIG